MQRTIIAATLLSLSVPAWADDPPATDPPAATESPPSAPATSPALSDEELARLAAQESHGEVITVAGAQDIGMVGRGVAEEFFVLPQGLDAGAKVRAITADDALGTGKLKLTDLALFDVHAEWAIASHFELDGTVSILPKQPSGTHETVFQGGSLTLRRDLVKHSAIALAASEAPLLGIKGEAFGGALYLTHKHRLNEIVSFAMSLGANSMLLRPTDMGEKPFLLEGAGSASVLVRVPNGMWGGWFGVSYALPAYHSGHDPLSMSALDPQPRLDVTIGNSVQLADSWDLEADLSIIDRGDLAAPATRLPILDGGFDQIQITVGVSRRFDLSSHGDRQRGISDPLIQL